MGAGLGRLVAALLGTAVAAGGCGRIGMRLTDLSDDGPGNPDSGELDVEAGVDLPESDAGTDSGNIEQPPMDAGGGDAAVADASLTDASLTDASLADAAIDAGEDATVDAGPQPCDFSGTWATKVTFPVTWSGNLGISSGSGTAQVWVRHQGTSDGNVAANSMVACGVTLPPISLLATAGGGTGRVDFGVPLFETNPPRSNTAPVQQVLGEGFPGDSTTLSSTAMVLGATLADPLNGSWPSAGQIVSHDVDGDGKPGITLIHLGSPNYVHLPTAAFGGSRTDRGYYASRVVLSATGTVVSCSEISGNAVISRFDSRILGCRLVSSGNDCSSGQADMLESFRPDHVPGAATYRAIKVADGASCTTVRSALP